MADRPKSGALSLLDPNADGCHWIHPAVSRDAVEPSGVTRSSPWDLSGCQNTTPQKGFKQRRKPLNRLSLGIDLLKTTNPLSASSGGFVRLWIMTLQPIALSFQLEMIGRVLNRVPRRRILGILTPRIRLVSFPCTYSSIQGGCNVESK